MNQPNIRIAAGLVSAFFASTEAAAATLPLQDGKYTRGACRGGTDITESISIHTVRYPQGVARVLSPNGEGEYGYCKIGALKTVDNRYSGSAKCSTGGSRMDLPSGSYRFSYDVIDQKTFVSRGQTYRWCAAGR